MRYKKSQKPNISRENKPADRQVKALAIIVGTCAVQSAIYAADASAPTNELSASSALLQVDVKSIPTVSKVDEHNISFDIERVTVTLSTLLRKKNG